MKITITTRKPRNPLVGAGRMRRAGSHRSGLGALRQRAERALKRDLDYMKHSP